MQRITRYLRPRLTAVDCALVRLCIRFRRCEYRRVGGARFRDNRNELRNLASISDARISLFTIIAAEDSGVLC